MAGHEDPRGMLPSERTAKKQELEAQAREQAEQVASSLREDFTLTFQTDHGKRVLAWLAQRCGWGLPPLAGTPTGGIDEKITTHNAMELSLYIAMRQHIQIEVLQQVEYGFIKPSGTVEGHEAIKRKSTKPTKGA